MQQVTVWPQAIAQYTVGHLERQAAIDAVLATLPGLSLCGSSYDGVSFGDAIASGVKAGERVATGLRPRVPVAAGL
jgi:oxygen-dependent protoporphyrinogen oxidase